jgi:hypothetical protein
MSQEERDATIGRVVREKKETEKQIATLEAATQHLGEIFATIGAMLKNQPAQVTFNGVSTDAKYSHPPYFDARDIDGGQIIKLTNELRSALDRLERLKAEAEKLGI